MFLGMQDFDFAQILHFCPNLPKFAQILPQKNSRGCGNPGSYVTVYNTSNQVFIFMHFAK